MFQTCHFTLFDYAAQLEFFLYKLERSCFELEMFRRSFLDEDINVFESVNDGIVAYWRHAMNEDIFVFEMQMKVIVAFWKHAMTEDIVVFEM